MLDRLLDGQPIDASTSLIGLDAFPRPDQVLARQDLRKQVLSPQAFCPVARRANFITRRASSGFTLAAGATPGSPRQLMRCSFERHSFQLSFSFGPSSGCPDYYGLC